MTTLTITPNLAKKTAKFAGAVAAGEHVEVTLKYGASIADTSSLRMRVVGPCGTLAIFPQPESEDAWEVDGEDLKCVLNLNTIQMLKALAPAIEAELLVVLDDAENHVLYFKDTCAFKHWPMRRGDDAPYDLDGFPGLIEEWREEIDNLAASVEKVGNVATISITDKDGTTTAAEVRDGEDGEDGEDGTDGVGIPAGGTTGQILVKASATDYDTEWRTAGGGGGEQANWNETDSTSPAYIRNKPTSFLPSAHKNSHKAGGSDAIAPSDIGALPSNAEDIDGYVMSFGGAQYALQTPYTQSGVDGWGTADGEWKLFVSASGSVLLLKNGVAKPTNPLSVAGLPLPWNLQLLDGSGTAVVSDAGATSTEEIIGHLRSHDNPHGVTAAQIGAAAAGDIPTALSQLDGDATHRVVTDVEKEAWNAKQNALTFDNAPTSGSANPVKSGGIHTALARKLDATNPVLFGMLNFETTINLLYNASSGNLATQGSGEDTPRNLAHIDELEYDAANDDTRPEGLAQPRSVSTYKVVAGTPLTITLPTVSASDKSVSNLDIIIDAIGVTTLPAITIQPATGGKAYAVKGTMPEIKADCITMIDATSIPGMNAWVVLGASELKEVTNA